MCNPQISEVKKNEIVAVIGQSGKRCELWFFIASKKSVSSEGFVEGHWLYELSVSKQDKKKTHRLFEQHYDDEVSMIAKNSIIEQCVKGSIEDNGVYSILVTTITELQSQVSYEDGTALQDGENHRIVAPSDENKDECDGVVNSSELATILCKAHSWREKVLMNNSFRKCYFNV